MTLDDKMAEDEVLCDLLSPEEIKLLSPEDKKMIIASVTNVRALKPEEADAFFRGLMSYQCPEDSVYKALREGAENGCKLAQIYPIQKYQRTLK